jgi:hypothetical protein
MIEYNSNAAFLKNIASQANIENHPLKEKMYSKSKLEINVTLVMTGKFKWSDFFNK